MSENRDVLRDEIAEALMRWAERNNDSKYAAYRRSETVRANAYSRADAVLAVCDVADEQVHRLTEALHERIRRVDVLEAELAELRRKLVEGQADR